MSRREEKKQYFGDWCGQKDRVLARLKGRKELHGVLRVPWWPWRPSPARSEKGLSLGNVPGGQGGNHRCIREGTRDGSRMMNKSASRDLEREEFQASGSGLVQL